MSERAQQSQPVWLVGTFSVILAAIGGAAALAARSLAPGIPLSNPLVPAVFIVLTVAAALILRFPYGGQVMALDLFEAALAPAIVTLPPLVVVTLVATAQIVANIARRNTLMKGSFNIGQWTAAAGIASVVYRVAAAGDHITARNIAALIAAMTAAAALNLVAFSYVIHLAEGHPIRRVAQNLAHTILLGWTINVAFGILFVAAAHNSPAGISLFLIPLGVLRWSFRGYASALADRALLKGMYKAGRAFATPLDPRAALPPFLGEVRKCFDASAATLILDMDGTAIAHTQDDAGARQTPVAFGSLEWTLARATKPTRLSARTDGALAEAGLRDAIVAPVTIDGRVRGVLCALDPSRPEGFEEGELAVLGSLATEAGAAISKGVLLATILEEREKLTRIVAATSDGIVMLDANGFVQLWNAGMERITGRTASEMSDAAGSIAKLGARTEAGTPVVFGSWRENVDPPAVVEIAHQDGSLRTLSCSYSSIAETDGRGAMYVIIARDVTEAREVERLKDDFVATVSHELRTPLTPIIGWASTLLHFGEEIPREDTMEAITSIKRQAEHLQEIVESLLETAQIDNGAHAPAADIVDPVRVVAKTVESVRQADPTRAIHFDTALEPIRVYSNEVRIRQIVSNLLSNALKYSPPNAPVTVRVAAARNEVRISVRDSGPGIAPNDREQIFERFRRLGNPMTRTVRGSGLGLYLARRLAESMGGRIELATTLGQGSTFTLLLPLAPALASKV